MKYVPKIFFVLLISLIINGCNSPVIKKDMVSFDQAFIPAYYFAYVGDLGNTQIAFVPLQRQWKQFKNKYTPLQAESCEDWNESVFMIDAWLAETNAAIKDEDVKRALFQLDHARYEMSDLRWRIDMHYYLDYVWDFEGSIGIALDVASDPMLDLLSWKEFYQLSTAVQQSWKALKLQTVEKELFGFSAVDLNRLQEKEEVIDKSVMHFLETVDGADRCEIEESIKTLEVNYLDFMIEFGAFKVLQTNYAKIFNS